MGKELFAAEKMAPNPLLAFQKARTERNGKTHVLTIPALSRRRLPTGVAGWLAALRPWARRWAVPSLVLNLVLIFLLLIFIFITITVLRDWLAEKSELYPGDPVSPVATCPDGCIGYLGKCYYFSEAEANWTDSQNHCSALGASLAVIDTLQEMTFLMRYKGPDDYWIGLWREPGQPWKWANGTEFNNWFKIVGGEKCAFLNHNDIASSGCSREGHWICSKAARQPESRAT